MPRKGKCVRYSRDLFKCKSKEVKELPCKHYCHSSCMVLFHEDEEEGKRHIAHVDVGYLETG